MRLTPWRVDRSFKDSSAGLASTMESNSQAQNSPEASISSLRACQHRVKQVLSLLSSPQIQDPQSSCVDMQHGLLHSLHDILHPLNDILPLINQNDQDISCPIGSTTQRATNSSKGLDTFMQNATTLLQLSNQVSTLLKEPMSGEFRESTVLQLLEKRVKEAPLQCKDQNEILLRLRKKRRYERTDTSPFKPSNSESTNQNTLSPLTPIPSQLSFEATTSWIDDLLQKSGTMAPKDACDLAVNAFNAYMEKRCLDESMIFKNSQGERYLAKRRVRARLASWNESRGEIQVELRDVGCATIQFDWTDAGIQILQAGVSSPSEYLRDQVNVLLPSKFGFYNDISAHLFMHALHRQNQGLSSLKLLCNTLMHVAGLRTLYDPLPAPPTQVSAIPSRTTYGSLKQDNDEFLCPVSWKWCQIACDSVSPDAQGEWVAFTPHML